MRTLTTTPQRPAARLRANAARLLYGRRIAETTGFTPLIDAKAASKLLGVPHTWLLAQARAGTIPHHRLGHYVRFNPEDLRKWLQETRIGAPSSTGPAHASRVVAGPDYDHLMAPDTAKIATHAELRRRR